MKAANQSRYHALRGLAAVAAVAFMLGGCASSPTSYSNIDHSVDFRQYETYAFAGDLSTDKQGYQSLESTYLKRSVSAELERRGLRPSAQPDVVIDFAIDSKEKMRSRSYPASGYYSGYYDPYYDYGWGMHSEVRIDQYTEGHLVIAAVDAESNKLVWEGSTKGRIGKKEERNVQATLDSAVIEIFQHFPVADPASAE